MTGAVQISASDRRTCCALSFLPCRTRPASTTARRLRAATSRWTSTCSAATAAVAAAASAAVVAAVAASAGVTAAVVAAAASAAVAVAVALAAAMAAVAVAVASEVATAAAAAGEEVGTVAAAACGLTPLPGLARRCRSTIKPFVGSARARSGLQARARARLNTRSLVRGGLPCLRAGCFVMWWWVVFCLASGGCNRIRTPERAPGIGGGNAAADGVGLLKTASVG